MPKDTATHRQPMHLQDWFWYWHCSVKPFAQNIVFYTFFCLPVSRDFAENMEILGFLDVDQLTSPKLRNLHWFRVLQWSKQCHLQDFNVWPCALMGPEGKLRCGQNTTVYETLSLHPRVCKIVFGLSIHLTTLSLFKFQAGGSKVKLSTLTYGAIKVLCMNSHEQIWPWDVLDKKIKKTHFQM